MTTRSGRHARTVAAAGALFLVALMFSRLINARTQPVAGGVAAGRLSACPDRPNCVGSQDPDPDHAVAPLACRRPPAEVLPDLAAWLARQPRVIVVRQTPEYVHATFRTRVWGFLDDVEFLADPGSGVIQVRSASRVGYSDLGANRRRIETLRSELSHDGVL